MAAILEPRRKTAPQRRPGTNLEHAASSHGRSHFNPDYRPRPRVPLLPLLALCINSVPSNAVLAGLNGNFFFLFFTRGNKTFTHWQMRGRILINVFFLWQNLGTHPWTGMSLTIFTGIRMNGTAFTRIMELLVRFYTYYYLCSAYTDCIHYSTVVF